MVANLLRWSNILGILVVAAMQWLVTSPGRVTTIELIVLIVVGIAAMVFVLIINELDGASPGLPIFRQRVATARSNASDRAVVVGRHRR